MLFEQGVLSQNEKLRVGKERNERLMAERTSILRGMSSELKARQQTVQIQSATAAQTNVHATLSGLSQPVILLSLVSVAVICFVVVIRRLKRATQE